MRKPLMVGLDVIRGNDWDPRLYTKSGASRYMAREAKKSPLRNAVHFVVDCGDHWRGSIGADKR